MNPICNKIKKSLKNTCQQATEFETIINNAPFGIAKIDSTFLITYYNKSLSCMLGIPDLMHTPLHELVPNIEIQLVDCEGIEKPTQSFSTQIQRPDQSAGFYKLWVSDSLENQERLIVFEDVTKCEMLREKTIEQEVFIEAHLYALHASSMVIFLDLNGVILSANERFLEKIELKEEQVCQKNISSFFVKNEENDSLLESLMLKMQEKSIFYGEACMKNKKTFWISLSAVPPTDQHGEVSQIIIIANDISKRKEKELQLQAAEKESREKEIRLHALFEAMTEGVCMVNEDGLIIFCNRAAASILCISQEVLLEKNIKDLTSPELADKVCVQKKFYSSEDETILSFKGQNLPISITCTPVFLNAYNMLITFSDLTEKKKSEKIIENQQIMVTSSAKMSSLGEMASGIAHEINNPLAVIVGKINQIKKRIYMDPIDREKIELDANRIETMVERITKIVKGLRSFSRNAEQDPMEQIKIKSIIDDLMELCKERFKNHSIDLTVTCPEELTIECRPSQIGQIIMNLLNNSHDAIEELQEKWITLDVTENETMACISITDSGNKIAPTIIEKMMDPFFTTKVVGKGTGLGLSISHRIATDHCGTLSYDASSCHTCFCLKIPKKQHS